MTEYVAFFSKHDILNVSGVHLVNVYVDYILHFKKSIYFAGIAFVCDAGAIMLSDICSVRKG